MELTLLLIAHILGDFIFQTSELAKKKTKSLKYFIIHCLIYSLMIFLALIWFAPVDRVILIWLSVVILHGSIDLVHIMIKKKIAEMNKLKKNKEFTAFLIDQLIHILVLYIGSSFIHGLNEVGTRIIEYIIQNTGIIQFENILIIVLLYLICTTPSSVVIRYIFKIFSLQEKDFMNETNINEDKEKYIRSGYLIGVLERIIMLTLGLSGQIGAIGFVLAAKSLARFKQLDDRNFAEKYLVGTLLSVVIALVSIIIGLKFI